uniref:Amidohydro-rel domain-containing protein n=1 Tax=Caenorhabditis japonica TaxID=281687 RepID=A0A8R1EG61_CAEJA
MNVRGKTINVKYAWIDGKIEENVSISVDLSGKIVGINRKMFDESVNLGNQVILPGFVNTHSHAFHRHLRGRSEIGKSAADTFWKWRDNMYGLVAEVTKEKIYEASLGILVDARAWRIPTYIQKEIKCLVFFLNKK